MLAGILFSGNGLPVVGSYATTASPEEPTDCEKSPRRSSAEGMVVSWPELPFRARRMPTVRVNCPMRLVEGSNHLGILSGPPKEAFTLVLFGYGLGISCPVSE